MAKLTIREDLCKGCGLCIGVCPKKILAFHEEKLNGKGYHPITVTDESACIACASCARICPDLVFTIEK
ncbi:MAG: 4Fe-4S dicluster domain-containing protein [Christensenellaceae bacterium]|jgi:2-oxoglutarate ferredoxin oxidoreductase subunit delta